MAANNFDQNNMLENEKVILLYSGLTNTKIQL